MRSADIVEGATYEGRDGSRRRMICTWFNTKSRLPHHYAGKVTVYYRTLNADGKPGYPRECLFESFRRWAVRRVEPTESEAPCKREKE